MVLTKKKTAERGKEEMEMAEFVHYKVWELVNAMSSVSKGKGDYEWLLMNYDPLVMKRIRI